MRRPRRLAALLACAAGLAAAGAADGEGRVYASPEAVEPRAVGERVPALPVHTVEGRPLDLARSLREEGGLLVFYRGGW